MENIFVIKTFDCNVETLHNNIEAQESYCTKILHIPDMKIYGTEMIGKGLLEIVLTNIEKEELYDDWYVNLHAISA